MLTRVEGIYRDGRIELKETPADVPEGAAAIVTFVSQSDIDLDSQGINKEQAAILRASFSTFAEDWDSTEMNIYDDYDAAKANS